MFRFAFQRHAPRSLIMSLHSLSPLPNAQVISKAPMGLFRQRQLATASVAPLSPSTIFDSRISKSGDSLTVRFGDATFTFHAQWLQDARVGVDKRPSRDATSTFCEQISDARLQTLDLRGHGGNATLTITWDNGEIAQFPSAWLRVMAPLVARHDSDGTQKAPSPPKGWLADELIMPEVSYATICPDDGEPKPTDVAKILDVLLHESAAGIIKVIGTPTPDVVSERNKENTIVTRALKAIFGSVFVHPRRGIDKTFNIASHFEQDRKRAIGLPNYDTDKVLLPHMDHAHYHQPAHVMGLYALEGESENTFVSGLAALTTLKEESPELYRHLCTSPAAVGRSVDYYDPPLKQATVDTPVTMYPGFPSKVKRFRWHPHLTGSLLTSYDEFHDARLAYRKFQEIMRRDSHQLKFVFKPGEMYIWNNFTILHGREGVFSTPRTSVGQTVPEQVVLDTYRTLKIDQLKSHVNDMWLVHMPTHQLCELHSVLETGKLSP